LQIDVVMADKPQGYDRIPLALLAILAAFLVVGLAASRFGPAVTESADSLPDLSNAQIVEVRDASGRAVLSGEFREQVDALGNVEKDAALVERGGRHVIGEVEIGIPGPAAITSGQEVDIDIIELQPNAKHSIFIDDREVATLTADDRGSIDVKLHSTTPVQQH
jgi:hypothetical protein